jgi:hypothetical protein
MDMIASQESRRINLLAIYSLLPCFPGDYVQKTFGEIARLTFTLLESFLHIKLMNGDSEFCSPSKVAHLHVPSTKVRINLMKKVSTRMETIKKEDPLLNIDLVDFFWAKMAETQRSLNVQLNLLILGRFRPDPGIAKYTRT